MEHDFDSLSVFAAECQSVLPHVKNSGRIKRECVERSGCSSSFIDRDSLFIRIWEEFSRIHQSSPSRVNNNITNRYHCTSSSQKGLRKRNDKVQIRNQLIVTLKSRILTTLGIFVNILELILVILTSLIIFFVILIIHKPTQALISRHSQDLIYPIMRGLRITTLPVVRSFPRLSELYEEDCLITNPNYFSKHNYECWPCEDSRQVIDMTGFSNFSSVYHHGGIPFRIRHQTSASEYDFSLIEKIYLDNTDLLSSATLSSNVNQIQCFADIFPLNRSIILLRHENLHIAWKINKVTYARYLRKYFSKPYIIPATTEVSIQHFLFLDNFKSPKYTLPFTEFENVFLHQAGGRRHIVLIPTAACYKKCRVISIVLQHGDVLFYNWLYWRPQSLPVESSRLHTTSDSSSITYIGSFY